MLNNMKILGLTGGTGAGKGEVSLCFLSQGIKCLDTDKVSRKVCEPGKPCLTELKEYFGDEIILPDGRLDRKGLAALVFGEENPEKREIKQAALNRITHKHIIDAINTWLKGCEATGDELVVVDAPQLFESGFDRHCDYIIGVLAEEETRIRRIISRDNISRETAEKRIRAQKSNQFFIDSCDFIVYNNAGIDLLEGQVEEILRKINYIV